MRPTRCLLLLILSLASVPGPLAAQGQANPSLNPRMVAAGFLDSHPDLRYRTRGLEEYGKKNFSEAFLEFQRAAYYSDKPSQAIVGEMYWIGLGAPEDRALAYVWMDLAAERGYRAFSAKRERYWNELDQAERERAVAQAPEIRAEYADSAAGPRLATVLLRERRRMTGSRLGSRSSPLQIVVPGVGTIDGSEYYNPKYWEPEQYRAWQDSIWQELRTGRVDVGTVEQVSDDPAIPAAGSQTPATPLEPAMPEGESGIPARVDPPG